MEVVDVLHGSFSLIFVIISFIIGFTILSKYSKQKNRLLILVGLTWVGLSFPWLPDSISFLMSLFAQRTLSVEWYFIIGNVFIPIALIPWMMAYTDMISRDRKRLYVALIAGLCILFEILFFTLFFIDIDLIGTMASAFSADLGILLIVFLFITMLIMLITGVKFARKSIKSEDREIILKGKLLQAAFIMFTIAALLEKTGRSIMLGLVFQNPTDLLLQVILAIVRTLLFLSAFAFYGGFLLPRWIKEILIRSK